jgi:hypothetical protein
MTTITRNKNIGMNIRRNSLKIAFESNKNFTSLSSMKQSNDIKASVEPPISLIGIDKDIIIEGYSFVIEVDTVISWR